ncbi:hypothetical protein SH449x_000756 [Pirellulaceae bacterium SH449]
MERKRIAAFTPEQAARTWEATEYYERMLGSSAAGLDYLPGERGILFRNDSGEEIPPYGLLYITGCVDDKFNYVKVDKPSSLNVIRSKLLVNGPEPVESGFEGTAQAGPVFRVIHDGSIAYLPGDRVGYINDSFLAGLNPTFLVLGSDDIADDCLRVMFDDSTLYGVAAGTITSSMAGNVTVSSPFAPVTRTHKAKTFSGAINSGVPVKLFTVLGEWIALEVCE